MLRPRKPIDVADTQARLDALQTAVHREVEGADADSFDDAMEMALVGLSEVMRAESGSLDALRRRLVRLG